MKQEIILFKELASPITVNERAMVTASDPYWTGSYNQDGGNLMLHKQLIGRHSTLGACKFTVRAWVEDRTHDHMVRHDLLNNYYACSTSRMELDHGNIHNDGEKEYRLIEFDIDLKTYIRIEEQRNCPSASVCTRSFFKLVIDRVVEAVPEVRYHADKPCVRTGYCTEPNTDCGYVDTKSFKFKRERAISLANSMRKSNRGKGLFKEWKNNYIKQLALSE